MTDDPTAPKHPTEQDAPVFSAVQNEAEAESGRRKCPVVHGAAGTTNRDWWPNQIDVSVLPTHSPKSDPYADEPSTTARRSSRSTSPRSRRDIKPRS